MKVCHSVNTTLPRFPLLYHRRTSSNGVAVRSIGCWLYSEYRNMSIRVLWDGLKRGHQGAPDGMEQPSEQ